VAERQNLDPGADLDAPSPRAAIAAATVSGAVNTERRACWWISASQIASSPQRSAASICPSASSNAAAALCSGRQ
jgi:hypothetical protein